MILEIENNECEMLSLDLGEHLESLRESIQK